ncbi:ABC transporter substrate-binding protein [Streptomyces calidiresistens]|uniref:ABC transporter substrate-binding protein n=1 Tax=Streptomyces calidiresistens TaxID=1485586 RepID=A0A7W3T4D7_9ACTN|nr:ABC transporter substrate-binding protein [Streptomyces calidiresistens]
MPSDTRPAPAGAGRTARRGARALAVAGAAALLLGACAAESTPEPAGADGTPAAGSGAADDGRSAADITVEPIEPAREITDVRGTTVATDAEPERIVCLVALCDDILTELGIVPVATNSELLAHPDFLGPEAAAEVPIVPGGFIAPEPEAILSHRPDLVIGLEDTHGRLAPSLEDATVFWTVQPESWEDSVAYLRDLAALTGRTEEAEEAELAFRTRLAGAEAEPSDRTALIIYGSDENFGVATPGTDVAAGLFPGIAHYPWESRGVEGTYSLEEILAEDVDVLFVETLSFGGDAAPLSEVFAGNPLWESLTAVREGEVHEVDPEVWAKGRGTRSLGIVLDEATAIL